MSTRRFIYQSLILERQKDGSSKMVGGRATQFVGRTILSGIRTMKCLSCNMFVSPKYRGEDCPHCGKKW